MHGHLLIERDAIDRSCLAAKCLRLRLALRAAAPSGSRENAAAKDPIKRQWRTLTSVCSAAKRAIGVRQRDGTCNLCCTTIKLVLLKQAAPVCEYHLSGRADSRCTCLTYWHAWVGFCWSVLSGRRPRLANRVHLVVQCDDRRVQPYAQPIPDGASDAAPTYCRRSTVTWLTCFTETSVRLLLVLARFRCSTSVVENRTNKQYGAAIWIG